MAPRPTRETRSLNKEAPETPGSKRKRRPSTSATTDSPLKVVLRSPASLSQNGSPVKTNGESNAAHEPKRQRLSLKVTLDKEEEEDPNALSREIRDALSTVISQMASNLPAPLNNVLTLWLPPSFAQKEENTLGYILKQPMLTWQHLADTLHLFSENLLVPCQYPNPVPPRSQVHLPVPPLPSHLRPHGIYNFCAALHPLLLDVEPQGHSIGSDAERWALVQKTPQAGEWFTNAVDTREAAKKGEQGSLDVLAGNGVSFGNATAMSLQSGLTQSPQTIPTLSDSVIRRASLKMNRWKEKRALQRAGGFGSIPRGVTIPLAAPVVLTPSFGPTFDSTYTTGGQGYYSTLEGMHERARHREWSKRVLRRSRHIEEGGYVGGTETAKGKGKEAVDDVLSENNDMLEELQAWQEVRVRKGVSTVTEREQIVAEQLLSSLTKLTGHVSPAEMIPASTSKVGLAHELARRFLPVSSPYIRGTLDPRRPQALHDNTTVRLKTPTAQAMGVVQSTNPASTAVASPHAPPPTKMPPPPIPSFSAPPPHTLPTSARIPTSHRGAPTPPNRPTYPYSPSPSGNNPNPIHARPSTASLGSPGPSSAMHPRSAGPSNLRQSFGPGPGPVAVPGAQPGGSPAYHHGGAYPVGMRG